MSLSCSGAGILASGDVTVGPEAMGVTPSGGKAGACGPVNPVPVEPVAPVTPLMCIFTISFEGAQFLPAPLSPCSCISRVCAQDLGLVSHVASGRDRNQSSASYSVIKVRLPHLRARR